MEKTPAVKKISEQAFLAQFPVKVEFTSSAREMLFLDQIAYDKYPVYRCLNRLFVMVDGEFYGARR